MVKVGIIGAGIVGLAAARQLAQSGVPVVVWEKEAAVAQHQTGHNSGVAHAGIYYQPGSAKAKNCRRGVELLRTYCAERSLPWDERGKLVVARDDVERQRLQEIERRSQANGVPGVRWLDGPDIRAPDLDPAVLARLLTVSASCLEALLGGGRRAAAEKLAEANVVAATHLSREDPAAMTARGQLALTLVRRGRIGEAEMLFHDLLDDRRRVQGDDHPDTLATRHELAAAIGLQGRYGQAEELYRQLLDDDYRLLGPDHRHTLAARHNLARMIGRQGRYVEAERLCREVLQDQRRLLGHSHPDTLATQHSLARIAGMAGRYGEAEQMYRQVLDARRQVLGNDHPDTLSTRHRLARMIGLQGRYADTRTPWPPGKHSPG